MEQEVKVSLCVNMLSLHDVRQLAWPNQAASTCKGKGLVHSKHRVRTIVAPPSSTRASDPGGRPNIIYRVVAYDTLTALTDRGPSTGTPLNEGPVV